MNKKSNIELLRIIAIIMVIGIHVISQIHYKSHIYLYAEAFMRISVPCFFMIMGYLFALVVKLDATWDVHSVNQGDLKRSET